MTNLLMTMICLSLLFVACGPEEASDSTLDVTNGAAIDGKQYPAVVKINVGSGSCTASFVAHDTLLTAAHCVHGKALGSDVRVFVHPLYRASGQANRVDLALIKFPTAKSNDVVTISSRAAQANDPITIVGFGLDDAQDPSSAGTKRVGTNKLLQRSNGLLVFSGLVRGPNTGSNAASASGDSGGPMFVGGKQVGVTSAGSIKGNTKFSYYVDLHSLDSKNFFQQANAAGISVPLPSGF